MTLLSVVFFVFVIVKRMDKRFVKQKKRFITQDAGFNGQNMFITSAQQLSANI